MSGFVVPERSGDASVWTPDGIDDLKAHLEALQTDAQLPINGTLCESIELQLNGEQGISLKESLKKTNHPTEANSLPLIPVLLPPLSNLLRSTQQDATPLVTLTTKLISPLTFPTLLELTTWEDLIGALASPLPGANLLALNIIHKAASQRSYVSLLTRLGVSGENSSSPKVIEQMISTWLDTHDTGVAEKSSKVLGDLLHKDRVDSPTVNGDAADGPAGSLWSIILGAEFVEKIQLRCSPSSAINAERTTSEITHSQARLLRILPRLASMNVEAVTRPLVPDAPNSNVLWWAAIEMVDRSDILMKLVLVDFFEELVSVMRVARDNQGDNASLLEVLRCGCRDSDVQAAFKTLPDRTVEEEAEDLKGYMLRHGLLG